ncbi:MAG: hypothetical protein M0P57_05955 [Syntrophales bacterium]|nr:hypothetical protein [Syntrophales bacterium]
MARQLIDTGFKDVYVLKGGLREWTRAQFPVDIKLVHKRECVSCHLDVTPGIVSDWQLSMHSKNMVSCSVCHGVFHMSEDDVELAKPVEPEKCGMCHEPQWNQFKAGKHAKAWKAMKAVPAAHWQPMLLMEGMKGCGGCHKIGIKTIDEIDTLREEAADFGIASCDSCHTRHTFKKAEAVHPRACQTCHMGFDHPQWEMYSSSKHGVRFFLKQENVLPEDAAAPVCQTCHMQGGNHEVRTPWGFWAIRLPLPQEDAWAAARKKILQAMGILDLEGNPTERFEVVKELDMARLTPEAWQQEREKMIGTCNKCHSVNFAKGELEKGDRMIRKADMILAEAVDIVAGLYAEGILKKPERYVRPFPDLLALHEAATSIELKLFHMFLEHRMRAFQGAFHNNPDYAFWYGWSNLRQDLTEIKEMEKELRKKKQKQTENCNFQIQN